MNKGIKSLFLSLTLLFPSIAKPNSEELFWCGASGFTAGCFCAYIFAKRLQEGSRSKKIARHATTPVAYFSIKGGIFNVGDYITIIDEIKSSPTIEGVIIGIESTGGSPGASYLLYNEIKRLAEKKPVIVVISSHCFSGGYLAACGAQWIIANQMSVLGSIGSRLDTFYFDNTPRGVLNGFKGDVIIDPVHTGKYKIVGHPNKKPTEEEREYLQKECDQGYEIFCALVEQVRKPVGERSEWAEGRNFWGEEALKRNLIDQCGGWTEAKEKMESLLAAQDKPGARKRKIEIYTYTPNQSSPSEESLELRGATHCAMRFSTTCQLM